MLSLRNKTFAIDICNTIADIDKEIELRLGHKPDPTQYFHPALLDKPTYFEDNLDIFLHAEPIENSIYILNEIAKYNNIVYITARPKISEFVTRLWLKKNGFPSGKIYFPINKAEIASKLGVDIAIDDAPFELERYIKAGIGVFVKKQPYNFAYANRFDWENLSELKVIGSY